VSPCPQPGGDRDTLRVVFNLRDQSQSPKRVAPIDDRTALHTTARPSVTSHPPHEARDESGRVLRLPGFSTRFRILLWCTLLVALALTASVVATRIVLLHHLAQEIDNDLTHELGEIGLGHAPNGSAPLSPSVDLDRQLQAALGRATPTRSQELLAISDGKVLAKSPARPLLALESDAALVHRWAGVHGPTFGTVQTSAGAVRFLAAPISVIPGSQAGSDIFVAASFVDPGRADVNTTVGIASTVGLLALVAAILVAWVIAGRILAPVRDLELAARSVTESDLSHRLEIRGNDELARLAGDFNAMLDRVESAFRSQRQFIDDAGHELRTPLTVIRGHLELMGDDPVEREGVRTIMTDELDRMARMVNDLLVLARAERPDFLQLAPVDITMLTSEVGGKAHSLASRRWRVGGNADVEMLADRQRLTQAWMQLAENATQHTAEGGLIELGSRVTGHWVELWVADDGEGVPQDARASIFEGFSRASRDRRTGEHFGLGLPIVRAIAEAHHGQVSVTESSFGGALFVIRLPLTSARSKSAP
jgi:two-component system, OmpR family, sensor kinase